jgi:hypothetical protein
MDRWWLCGNLCLQICILLPLFEKLKTRSALSFSFRQRSPLRIPRAIAVLWEISFWSQNTWPTDLRVLCNFSSSVLGSLKLLVVALNCLFKLTALQ